MIKPVERQLHIGALGMFTNGYNVFNLVNSPGIGPSATCLALLIFVRRSLSDIDLSGVRPASVGVRQLFQIATSPTFPIRFF